MIGAVHHHIDNTEVQQRIITEAETSERYYKSLDYNVWVEKKLMEMIPDIVFTIHHVKCHQLEALKNSIT